MVWTFPMNRLWKFKLNILEAEVLTALWQIASGSPHFSSHCYRLNHERISGVSQTSWQIWREDFQAEIPTKPQINIQLQGYLEDAYRLHGDGVLKWDVWEVVYAHSPLMMWKSFWLKFSRENLTELSKCSITISSTARTKYLCDLFSWNLV